MIIPLAEQSRSFDKQDLTRPIMEPASCSCRSMKKAVFSTNVIFLLTGILLALPANFACADDLPVAGSNDHEKLSSDKPAQQITQLIKHCRHLKPGIQRARRVMRTLKDEMTRNAEVARSPAGFISKVKPEQTVRHGEMKFLKARPEVVRESMREVSTLIHSLDDEVGEIEEDLEQSGIRARLEDSGVINEVESMDNIFNQEEKDLEQITAIVKSSDYNQHAVAEIAVTARKRLISANRLNNHMLRVLKKTQKKLQ